jgi:ubiquitin-conjugating enzyme E2 variant
VKELEALEKLCGWRGCNMAKLAALMGEGLKPSSTKWQREIAFLPSLANSRNDISILSRFKINTSRDHARKYHNKVVLVSAVFLQEDYHRTTQLNSSSRIVVPRETLLEFVSETNSCQEEEEDSAAASSSTDENNSSSSNNNSNKREEMMIRRSSGCLEMGISDTALESTWVHRFWVFSGSLAVTGMMMKACLASSSSSSSTEDFLQVITGAFAAYVLADLATGFYHWGIDNYGGASTPVFGAQIDAFQGHHQRPWTITKREFCNNIHAIARPTAIFLAPFLVLPSHPFADSFLGIFLGFIVMSQQIHAWAHMKKSQLPKLVLELQERGFLVSRKMHGAHHKPPYDVNYCILSGAWNPLLANYDVFKALERFIYSTWHIAPRAWSETSQEWLQTGTYFEDGSELDSSQSS